tara:strand:+ start:232 stop:981 length:750 start_codon:yes stop_codon:yes gene_type:complete
MKNLCKLICVTALVSSSFSWAAGGGPLFEMHVDVHHQKSLQRGAKTFVNYCLSCHSASFSRYNRVAADLGISDENMREHMIFTGRKLGDTMKVALTVEQGKEWFGAPPPDLSVKARARGANWIYSYLKSFYVDESAIRGVNNLQFPGTSMPHVLWEYQGLQKLAVKEKEESHAGGHGNKHESPFEIAVPGKLTPKEYDAMLVDLVNFLVYMGEPAQLKRQGVGVGVLFFLAALGVLAYFMKRDYWKDVH